MTDYQKLLTLKALAAGKQFLIFRGIQTLYPELRDLSVGLDLRHRVMQHVNVLQDTMSWGTLGRLLLIAHDLSYIDGELDRPENKAYHDAWKAYSVNPNVSEVEYKLAKQQAIEYSERVPEYSYRDDSFLVEVITLEGFVQPTLIQR